MLTPQQKTLAQAIVNIFETGRPEGDYARVTLARGDRGGLSYGRSQATLAHGNLHRLLRDYCDMPNAAHANALRPYLPRLRQVDWALNRDAALHRLLHAAGEDPAMRLAQDRYFDRAYWDPAMQHAERLGLALPLSALVVYDSCLHGSFATLRNGAIELHGTPAQCGERAWTTLYLSERKLWLATRSNALLRTTVYRMNALLTLVAGGNWTLQPPLQVRGHTLSG